MESSKKGLGDILLGQQDRYYKRVAQFQLELQEADPEELIKKYEVLTDKTVTIDTAEGQKAKAITNILKIRGYIQIESDGKSVWTKAE